jgi:hypothetical protein
MEKINEDKGSISPQEKEALLYESITLKTAVDEFNNLINHVRSTLNVQPEEEYVDEEEYSDEEYSDEEGSDYSYEDDSRPSKRPRN